MNAPGGGLNKRGTLSLSPAAPQMARVRDAICGASDSRAIHTTIVLALTPACARFVSLQLRTCSQLSICILWNAHSDGVRRIELEKLFPVGKTM